MIKLSMASSFLWRSVSRGSRLATCGVCFLATCLPAEQATRTDRVIQIGIREVLGRALAVSAIVWLWFLGLSCFKRNRQYTEDFTRPVGPTLGDLVFFYPLIYAIAFWLLGAWTASLLGWGR